MRFKLTARDKTTKKDVTIQWFDDESMFDTMLDTVDSEIYQDAMILEMTGTLPVCRKYKEFKDFVTEKTRYGFEITKDAGAFIAHKGC